MNQSSNETSGINLPPMPEQASSADSGQETAAQTPETRPAAGSERTAKAGAAAPAAMPAMPLPTADPAPPSPKQTAANDVSATSNTGSTGLINDSDLIEKEWVDKAKSIVEKTHDDPYQQTEQLTEVRADYMQKNYNKTIKTSK